MNDVDIEIGNKVVESEKLEGKEINILTYHTEYETINIQRDNLKIRARSY